MQTRQLTLYTRPDCHLCELAEQMLEECRVSWQPVDIESDLGLIRKYGNHIPVLYCSETDRELYWPFNAATVRDFVELEI